MATVAILLLPVLNPITRHPLRKVGAAVIVGLVGFAIYCTPTFQERFFLDDSGGTSQIATGDFDSAGRFEAWPRIWEEALKRPWFGHGVGSAQEFVPLVWENAAHPCNDYLRVAFEFGAVGLTLFFSILCWQMFDLGRCARCSDGVLQQVFAGAWLGLAAFLIVASTDNPIVYNLWYMDPVFALVGAAYGVATARNDVPRSAPPRARAGVTGDV